MGRLASHRRFAPETAVSKTLSSIRPSPEDGETVENALRRERTFAGTLFWALRELSPVKNR